MTTDSSDCATCAKEHEAHAREHAAMQLPISSIRNGWVQNGALYLVVRDSYDHDVNITVPRFGRDGTRFTS